MPHFGEGGRKPQASGLEIAGIPEDPVEQAVFLLEQWVAICEPLMRQNALSAGSASPADEFQQEVCTRDRAQKLFARLIDQIQESNRPAPLTQTLFNICAQKPKVCQVLIIEGFITPTLFEADVDMELSASDIEDSETTLEQEGESEPLKEDNVFLLRIPLSSQTDNHAAAKHTGGIVFEIGGEKTQQIARLYALLTALVAVLPLLRKPPAKAELETVTNNLLVTKTLFNYWQNTRSFIPPGYTREELRNIANFLDGWRSAAQSDNSLQLLLVSYLEAPATPLKPEEVERQFQEWYGILIQRLRQPKIPPTHGASSGGESA